MRIVGLDVSRSVAEIAYLEDGVLRAGGRAGLRRDELERFAAHDAGAFHLAMARRVVHHSGRLAVARAREGAAGEGVVFPVRIGLRCRLCKRPRRKLEVPDRLPRANGLF